MWFNTSKLAEYIQEERLRQAMDSVCVCEKNRERIERRSAFTASEIRWLAGREQWEGLGCIGAVHTEVQIGEKRRDEWHYYISSRALSADELLNSVKAYKEKTGSKRPLSKIMFDALLDPANLLSILQT